jgi:hypothetical protein
MWLNTQTTIGARGLNNNLQIHRVSPNPNALSGTNFSEF